MSTMEYIDRFFDYGIYNVMWIALGVVAIYQIVRALWRRVTRGNG